MKRTMVGKRAVQREINLIELAELYRRHGLQSFTGDARIVPDRKCQICVGAVAILHGEGGLMLLSLHQHANKLAYQAAKLRHVVCDAKRKYAVG